MGRREASVQTATTRGIDGVRIELNARTTKRRGIEIKRVAELLHE